LLKSRLVYVMWALLVAASVALALVSVHAGDHGGGGLGGIIATAVLG
jgi:hypothetical protein